MPTPPYTIPATAVPGSQLRSADWNAGIRDSLEAVAKPPRAKVWRNVQLSPKFTGSIKIPFTTVVYDTDTFWSSAQPTRLTLPVAGTWHASCGYYFESNATGAYRLIGIYRTAVTIEQFVISSAGAYLLMGCSTQFQAAAGDYIELHAQHDIATALGISDPGQMYSCWMATRLVARA